MFSQKNFFKAIQPFEVYAKYTELDSHSPKNVFDAHIHNECEIYINLSGDVSFIVENHIYPIAPGNIIITRPFEYHHCVYHSNKLHKHFWFLFSATGNEYLFDKFYNRKAGENNLLILEKNKADELISVCKKMIYSQASEFEKYISFFKIIETIQNASTPDKQCVLYSSDIVADTVANTVEKALAYINGNLSYPISVSEIAKEVNVSVNTLERYFKQFLDVTPVAYIRKKRFSNAARLLSEGSSVTEASEESGFRDCSAFIRLFKKTYGQTPYVYKKNIKKI